MREKGPTPQMPRTALQGIGEAEPIDTWGEPRSTLGVPYDAV
jgi:hypothetical protein